MPYPSSNVVQAGSAILASHMNTIRSDALYFGQSAEDAVALAIAMRRWAQFVTLVANGTNKIRVPFDPLRPPTLMVNGCLLQATANIDSGVIAGAAGTYYVLANRNAGNTSFTLSIAASPVEDENQRLIGWFEWSGAAIKSGSIKLEGSINAGGSMKRVQNVGYEILPVVTDPVINVSPGGSAYGAWTQMRAATGNELQIVAVMASMPNYGNTRSSLQIGSGAAGAETVIAEVLLPHLLGGTGVVVALPFPVQVAAGTRIAVRATGSYAIQVGLQVIQTANLIDF